MFNGREDREVFGVGVAVGDCDHWRVRRLLLVESHISKDNTMDQLEHLCVNSAAVNSLSASLQVTSLGCVMSSVALLGCPDLQTKITTGS